MIWAFAIVFPFIHHVPATVISLLIAAAGVVVGIASRPFIENLVSGMVITFGHTLRVGHTVVVDDHYGTVEDISITHTTIKVWNWRRYIIPNSRMLQKDFVNLTISDSYQWAHVEFYVAYGTDLQVVRNAAIEAAEGSSYFSGDETPRFWVMDLKRAAVKCWVAAWASSPTNAWLLRHEIRTHLVLSLSQLGIRTHLHEIDDGRHSPTPEEPISEEKDALGT
jgi:small-conductance mechanosensitive channel